MNIKQRLTHGFFYIFTGRVGAGVLTVLTTPLVVRVLGSGGYGDYAFAMAVYSALRTLAGGGVYEGARKYIAEYPDREDKAAVFSFYLTISFLSGATIALGLVLFTYGAIGTVLLEYRLRNYLYIVAVMVFFHAFYHLVRSSLMGFKLEEYSETMYVLNRVFFPIIGLPLAVIGFHVSGILIGHAASTFLIVSLGYVALKRQTNIRVRGMRSIVPNPAEIFHSRMFRYGLLNVVFVLLTKSLYITDILLLQPFVTSERVGFYNASLVVAEFLWFVPLALQIVLLHSASQLWTEGRTAEITAVASNITRYTLLLTGGVGIVLAIVGDSFLPIYFGGEFTASYVPMLLLLPGVVGFAVARPIYAIGQGHGNMRALIYGTGGAAILNVVLNLALIPQFGVYGAAVATSVGYGSMLIFHILAAKRLGFNPLRNVRLGRVVVTCTGPIPILWLIDRSLESNVLSIVVVTLVGLASFFLLAWATRALSRSEVVEVLETVPRVRQLTSR
ncbi:flippase [Natrarchaeobius halalkaliphilus]|uniref:Flippase n=1 Tax=Natrarchaeobius halalkaliphilus TaxID=1679091 RepID=A0A3N6MGR4_9EURY|nr:flippase [Natrarchaeobius halalkaliphilus]RQG93166.1 flippase [Natrarchaeobius halalkaliphilus]